MAQYRQSKYTRGDVDGGNAPSLSVRDVVGKQYDESYEAARQNFVPTRGRGGKRPTNARRSYNVKRTESMRVTRGKESIRQISEALDAKLGVGLKEAEDALNQTEANRTMKAVTLLVTTRTMGFCAAHIYFQCSAQRNPVYCNIYAFYRVNLALFEARLYNIRKIQVAPIQHADEVYEVPTRQDFLQVTQTVNAYPDKIGRVIKALGPVTEGEYLSHTLQHALSIALSVTEAEKQERFSETFYAKFDESVSVKPRSTSRSDRERHSARRTADARTSNYVSGQQYRTSHSTNVSYLSKYEGCPNHGRTEVL